MKKSLIFHFLAIFFVALFDYYPPSNLIRHAMIVQSQKCHCMPEFEKAKVEPVSEIQTQDLSIEQEIERPRCHDVMTLHSEFDRLCCYCEETPHLSH